MAAKEGPPPPGIAELGDDVWRGDKPSAQRGIVVLGTPVGHADFVQAWADARLQEERRLLDELPHLPDLQCAWLLLLFCASPRANHALRTLPPSESASYARAHDQAVWETLQECLGGVPPAEAQQAWPLASLPAVHGGLGLQSAERTAPAAYWAAWMDALPVIRSRLPGAADRCLAALEQGAEGTIPCLREAATAKNLQREGWEACPGWHAAYEGARPPQPRDAGPGEWPHGWQFHATRTRNFHYRDCRLCTHPHRRCYARKAGHTLVHGCQQCRANQHLLSPRRPYSSRCGAACVYPCRSAQTVAAPAPVVGSRSTSTGSMASLALAQGCWLAERKPSSGLGCAWPARRSDQMGKSSLNNGSCAQPHMECQLTTADGST